MRSGVRTLGVLLLVHGILAAEQRREPPLLIAGSWSGHFSQQQVAIAFEKITGVPTGVGGRDNRRGFRSLAEGKMNVLIYSPQPSKTAAEAMAEHFPKEKPQPTKYTFGQFAVYVVVNKANTTAALTYKKLRDIYSGKIKDWKDVSGQAGRIILIGELARSKSREMFRNEVLGDSSFALGEARLRDYNAVVTRVKKERHAIGYCLYRQVPIQGVRIVAIAKSEKGSFHLPTEENIFEGKYPLVEDLTLYLPPKARPVAKAYCEFAIGPEGGKIAKKCNLYSEYERQQHFARKRLALMKAGKGVAIRGVGSMGGSAVMRDLAVEYVKAEKVVQMACRPATTELTAVGYFVNAKDRELLVLDGPVSEQAMKLHGKKWDFLEPETHVLASGRGIAICVNSMNKLRSLTLEQVRHLFSKKTTTWRDVTGAEVKIKRYGLVGTDPAARVFYNRINPPAACARAETRQGTQGVLAALSRDPHGIAFVDAAAANDLLAAAPGKSGIKVLSIGAKGKAAAPTAANVKAGKYPIAQRLTLHVSPRASQTTRDFVTFILSGAADEVFTKHGLTPAPRPKPTPQKPATKSPAPPVAGKKGANTAGRASRATPANPRKPTAKNKP